MKAPVMAKCDCIDRGLTRLFYNYGKFVSRWPSVFILISLIVAAALSVGIMFLKVDTDVIFLFTPDNSQARDDAVVVYDDFPTDYDEYTATRGNGTDDLAANIIIAPKAGDDVLAEDVFSEILRFDRELRNVSITNNNGMPLTYESLCAMSRGVCLDNPVLEILNRNVSYLKDVNLTYPFFEASNGESYFLGTTFGDVELGNNETILRAGLFALNYILQTTPLLEEEGMEWETEFESFVDNFESDAISVSFIHSHTLDSEVSLSTQSVIPLFSISYTLLFTFAITSCVMFDWVFSKPFLGFMGTISASLAVASSLGLLSYAGVNFNIVTSSMPFLIIGIGIDDMFIMLAAWRKTSPCDSVEERMGKAFSEAAVSITITSITDALAFGIGSINPLPAVRVFCLYTGVAVIFDYIFQITFFGACMALTGRREAANRHVWTLMKVKSPDEAPSTVYKFCCAGGLSEEQRRERTVGNCETGLMTFFKEYYGPFMMKPAVKFLTLLAFCAYLGGAIYGCLNVSEGLELKLLARSGSPAYDFFERQTDHFSTYGPFVSVVIQESLNYSDATVQQDLEALMEDFESSEYIHSSEYTEFWLRDFLKFLDAANVPASVRSDPDEFSRLLANQFLANPSFSRYSQDIIFEEGSNDTVIESSRFILTGDSLVTTNQQVQMMSEVRDKASEADITLTTFSPFFIVYEQYARIRSVTIQNLSIAVAAMFVVAFFLIPNIICSVVVALCIASIEVGIVGYMSLWDVRLDSISMINLILCIGFSVDFSAHITYSFLSGQEEYDGRHMLSIASQHAVMALYSLGMPILQGAISTIIAIIALNWSTSYIFVAFFKVMLLVMLFGILHSLVFLPVLLSSFGCCFCWSNEDIDRQDNKVRVSSNGAQNNHRTPQVHNNAAFTPEV
ncbi:patched domain-containing protein 3-like [Diadema antillarum]|uniref:patched domain-containing protein 3-like n=1 Tax=Diadema antillarum TaxID=105358 RepID=UPI003A88E67A